MSDPLHNLRSSQHFYCNLFGDQKCRTWQPPFTFIQGIFALASLTTLRTHALLGLHRHIIKPRILHCSTCPPPPPPPASSPSSRIWISQSLWILDQLVRITLDIDMLIESITQCYCSGRNCNVTIAMLMVMGDLYRLFFTVGESTIKANQDTVIKYCSYRSTVVLKSKSQ